MPFCSQAAAASIAIRAETREADVTGTHRYSEARKSIEVFPSPIIFERLENFLMSQLPKAVAIGSQIPRWIIVFAALASLLLAVGAGISLLAPQRLVAPGVEINSAAQIYAGYTFSRDLGLFIVFCVGLIKRSRSIMTVMMGLFSLINFCDAIIDINESRLPVFVIAFLLSLIAAMATMRLSERDLRSVV
jgi:hypothetical protein